MRVIGLDPAAHCGFCWSDGTTRHYGVWNLRSAEREKSLFDELTRLITERGCDMLAAEEASFGSHNPNVQAMHNQLAGVIRLVASQQGVSVSFFNPGTVKVYATGSGRAKKPQMVRACKTLLGIVTTSDDVADAIWIAELARRPDCWAEKKAKKPRKGKKPKVKTLFS